MSHIAAPLGVLIALLGLSAAVPMPAAPLGRIHGLWVWKASEILGTPAKAEQLRDFCLREGINEIYLSAFGHGEPDDTAALSTVQLLHRAHLRVEALLSSTDADEPGKHRDKLLDQVRSVVKFNSQHPGARLDGIHLDIEPQQRPENKGAGNLRFLPGLIQAYGAVRTLASGAGLTVNADIQNKLLKGSLDERRALLQSLPRLTLMLYELNGPDDGSSAEQKADRVRSASRAFLVMAYQGLTAPDLATMVIALRTPDYGELLPQMLNALDEANGSDPHYQGWARHSYSDVPKERIAAVNGQQGPNLTPQ